jgi:hypothetical protein
VAVLELDREHRVRERFDDRPFHFDRVSFCHRRSGSLSHAQCRSGGTGTRTRSVSKMAIPFKPQANGLAGLGLGLRWAGCKAALAGEHSNLGLMARGARPWTPVGRLLISPSGRTLIPRANRLAGLVLDFGGRLLICSCRRSFIRS